MEAGLGKECVIFIHIPKTAGSTLRRILEAGYPPEEKLLFYPKEEMFRAILGGMGREKLERLRFISAHIPFGFHRMLPHEKVRHICFLRDPLERVISLYYFALGGPGFHRHEEVKAQGVAWLLRPDNRHTDNVQVRYLAGEECLLKPAGAVDESDLQTACRNLENHIDFLGLTERFDESLLMLAEEFGVRAGGYFRENSSHRPRDPSEFLPETKAALENRNRLDRRLYEFGKALFEKRLGRRGPVFHLRRLLLHGGKIRHEFYHRRQFFFRNLLKRRIPGKP